MPSDLGPPSFLGSWATVSGWPLGSPKLPLTSASISQLPSREATLSWSWVPSATLLPLRTFHSLFCLFCFVLFCFVLFCFVLFCFVLFCFVLFCFVLFCFVLFCFVLFCFVLFCFVLFCFITVWITLCPV